MKLVSYLGILLFISSCQEHDSSKKWDKVKVTEEVTQMLEDYHTAIKKDGLTAEFQYLDHSADFFWVPPGYNSMLNYDSVRSILTENAKGFSSIQFEWDRLQVFPLSEEIANYSGIVKGILIDTAGERSKVAIIESGTLIKREAGWKLLSGQSALLEDHPNK